jgi:UDP-galactopyranose mutase
MSKPYDFLIVGAGFYGATCARVLTNKGYKCLVIEKRNHIGGNCYTENIHGIHVHKYGPHIFHTDNKEVLDFISRFTEFNQYFHNAKACIDNQLVDLPINLNTLNSLYRIQYPPEARKYFRMATKPFIKEEYSNFREKALSLVGIKLYNLIYKDYTEKQWGVKDTEIPAFIAERLPVRTSYNNNYFHHSFQGMPSNGYTKIFENMLDGIKVMLNIDFMKDVIYFRSIADNIIYSGSIDDLFLHKEGSLAYRGLEFHQNSFKYCSHQGTSIINYPSKYVSFTRAVEHKHFYPNNKKIQDLEFTVVTIEYPSNNGTRFYPINNEENNKLYESYKKKLPNNIHVGGRLGSYRYMDMDVTIDSALQFCKQFKNK